MSTTGGEVSPLQQDTVRCMAIATKMIAAAADTNKYIQLPTFCCLRVLGVDAFVSADGILSLEATTQEPGNPDRAEQLVFLHTCLRRGVGSQNQGVLCCLCCLEGWGAGYKRKSGYRKVIIMEERPGKIWSAF